MDERFLREESLLKKENMQKLRAARVAVVGLGGVGSWCAEALARSGIGTLYLVDEDTVSRTNINRQLFATEETVSRPKAEAAAERIRSINPDCCAVPMHFRYEAAAREAFFRLQPNYVVDAIDLVSCKVDLICECQSRGIPVVSALGTGNKMDAQLLRITDISKTEGCPLARVVRKELRQRGINHHAVVFSPEQGMEPEAMEAPPPGRRSVPGSVCWVPAAAGLLLCQHVVTELIKKELCE